MSVTHLHKLKLLYPTPYVVGSDLIPCPASFWGKYVIDTAVDILLNLGFRVCASRACQGHVFRKELFLSHFRVIVIFGAKCQSERRTGETGWPSVELETWLLSEPLRTRCLKVTTHEHNREHPVLFALGENSSPNNKTARATKSHHLLGNENSLPSRTTKIGCLTTKQPGQRKIYYHLYHCERQNYSSVCIHPIRAHNAMTYK